MGREQSLLSGGGWYVLCVLLLVGAAPEPLSLFGQPIRGKNDFSLRESVHHALQNNLSLDAARIEKQLINRQRWEAVGRGLPQITGNLRYQYNAAIQQTIIPNFLAPAIYQVLEAEELTTLPPNTDFGSIPLGFGTKHNANLGVNVQQMLLDATYYLTLKASRASVDYADKAYREAEMRLVANVKKSYYAVLYAEKQQSLLQKNHDRLAILLAQQEKLHENGFSEQADVDRLTVSLHDTKLAMQEAANEETRLRMLLNIQMGLPAGHPTRLSDRLQEENFVAVLQRTQVVNTGMNPEVQKLEVLTRLSKLNHRHQVVSSLPKLSFVSSLGYNSGGEATSDLLDEKLWFEYAVFGVQVDVPIFSGLKNVQIAKQRKLEWLRAQKNKEMAAERLSVEQVTRRNHLSMRVEMIAQRKKSMELSQSVYNTTKKKYRQGISSYLEVLDASTVLANAETAYYRAIYEALVAVAEVERVYGLSTTTP